MKKTKFSQSSYFYLFFFCLLLFNFYRPTEAASPATENRRSSPPLQGKILSTIAAHPSMQTIKTGVYAVSLETGQVLTNLNADDLFIPASNQKLFTTAASLVKLGPNYTFPTIVYALHRPKDGIISGDLYVKGFGDPYLVNEEIWEMARQIKLAGVNSVQGNLIFDDSFFAHDEGETNKPLENGNFWYNAESSALAINFSTITFTIQPGSQPGQKPLVQWNPATSFVTLINKGTTSARSSRMTISLGRQRDGNVFTVSGRIPVGYSPVTSHRAIKHPSAYAAQVLKEALIEVGVKCSGSVREGLVPNGAKIIWQHKSKALATIIDGSNKISNNFIAQQLLRTLGAEVMGAPGTTSKGLAVIRDFLQEIQVGSEDFLAADGCGLSRENATTPRKIVDLLTYMQEHFEYQPEYLSSLAIAGVDGTLRNRLKQAKTRRQVRAKTGYIRGVSCLSGYAFSIKNGTIAFSIMMNGKMDHLDICKKIQDSIVTILLEEM